MISRKSLTYPNSEVHVTSDDAPPNPANLSQGPEVQSLVGGNLLPGYQQTPAATIATREAGVMPPTSEGHVEEQDPQPIICQECNGEFKTQDILKRHRKTRHVGTRCHWGGCQQDLGTTKDLYAHLREHQREASVNDESGSTICHWPGCGRSHNGKGEVMRQIRKHNSDESGRS
ncbi:hypothetical protein F4781DRAFT_399454 [Annulohypoxylon bovei var. microspora]|nr:hypothetical protein F4781DRAFT_399454 [Annulohypoxylon bovei var. microspora]